MARPRSWTGTDLRHAVEVASCWRDTARTLGLAPISTRSLRAIRRRAQALGPDHTRTSAGPMDADSDPCHW